MARRLAQPRLVRCNRAGRIVGCFWPGLCVDRSVLAARCQRISRFIACRRLVFLPPHPAQTGCHGWPAVAEALALAWWRCVGAAGRRHCCAVHVVFRHQALLFATAAGAIRCAGHDHFHARSRRAIDPQHRLGLVVGDQAAVHRTWRRRAIRSLPLFGCAAVQPHRRRRF